MQLLELFVFGALLCVQACLKGNILGRYEWKATCYGHTNDRVVLVKQSSTIQADFGVESAPV